MGNGVLTKGKAWQDGPTFLVCFFLLNPMCGPLSIHREPLPMRGREKREGPYARHTGRSGHSS